MKVKDLIEKTGWNATITEASVEKEIKGAFVGDLLSWVMGNGVPSQAWVSVQAHNNVIAVALLNEFSCVILAQSAMMDPELLQKAQEEDLTIIHCDLSAYDICKKLIELGI